MEWLRGLGGHQRPPRGDDVWDGSEMRTRRQDPGGAHSQQRAPRRQSGEEERGAPVRSGAGSWGAQARQVGPSDFRLEPEGAGRAVEGLGKSRWIWWDVFFQDHPGCCQEKMGRGRLRKKDGDDPRMVGPTSGSPDIVWKARNVQGSARWEVGSPHTQGQAWAGWVPNLDPFGKRLGSRPFWALSAREGSTSLESRLDLVWSHPTLRTWETLPLGASVSSSVKWEHHLPHLPRIRKDSWSLQVQPA